MVSLVALLGAATVAFAEPARPPVDVFTPASHAPLWCNARPATPAFAEQSQPSPTVPTTPTPPPVEPPRGTPPGPVYPGGGEPLAIHPAASAVSSLASADRDFAERAARLHHAHITLAKLALQRGSTDDVRAVAQRLINDHMAAQRDLRTLTEAHNVGLPDGVDAEHARLRDELGRLTGTRFDRAWVTQATRDAASLARLFAGQAEGGQDSFLRGWAARVLPRLQAHQHVLRNLGQDVGSDV